METINKPEEGPTPPAIAGRDQALLSLNELIAEIDSETAVPFDRGRTKEEISPGSDGMQPSLQNQYILLSLEKNLYHMRRQGSVRFILTTIQMALTHRGCLIMGRGLNILLQTVSPFVETFVISFPLMSQIIIWPLVWV